MNTSTASQSFEDLEGILQMAVEQIASAPPPMESAERVLARAAKWGAPEVRTPVKVRTRLYLTAVAALALVLLVAVTIAMFGGLPREKSIALPPKAEKTEPENKSTAEPENTHRTGRQGRPPNAAAGISPATGVAGVPSPPAATENDMRLGARPGTGFGGTGGFGASGGVPSKRGGAFGAGTNPSRSFSVAGEATILVSTGGKDPIQLGEKQAFTKEIILHVWDWSKSDKSRPLEASSGSFSVSPDGKWIVTSDGQKIEIVTGKVSPLPNFEPQPHRILFSAGGRHLALLLGGENNTATFRILEFPGGKKLCEIENQWPAMLPAAFSPTGSEIFLMGKDNFVRRYDAESGKELQKYEPAHQNSVRAMTVSPSGKYLVSGGSRGDILRWDVASGKLLQKLVVEPAVYADMGVYSLAFSPDETQVVGGGIGSLLLWSVETGQVKKFPRGSASAEHIRFAVDGKSVTIVHGFHGAAGAAGEALLVYPSVSKWDLADAK